MSSDKLAQALRTLADKFSEGWHDGIRIEAFLMADNPDDLRCAQWVIANGSAKRRDGDE